MLALSGEPDLDAFSRVAIPLHRSRDETLEALVRAHTRVAHIGCTDSPYTDHRIRSGGLLHQRLVAASDTEIVGFDIDEAALEVVANALPGAPLICADVTESVPVEHVGSYDLVVAGEVVEHVPDVGSFLRGCHALLSEHGQLCVTVPNACSPKIGIRALLGRESVHPDHHYYFGPRTLDRALRSAGFEDIALSTYLATPSSMGRILNLGLLMAHRLRRGPIGEGLIALAR